MSVSTILRRLSRVAGRLPIGVRRVLGSVRGRVVISLTHQRAPTSAPPSPPDDTPSVDPDFPFLTFSQAARLRRLVRSAFAERGIECVIENGSMRDESGNSYGLRNLAATVAELDRSQWPAVIDNHVRIILTQPSIDSYPDESTLAGLRLRLVDLDSVPFLADLPHVRAVAPGLVEVLTIDLPESVVTPANSDISQLGAAHDLVSQGRRGLQTLLREDLQTRHVIADDEVPDLGFDFVLGDSFYIASLALVLDDLLDDLAPGQPRDKGVFVAVPNRHHLAYRIVTDMASLMSVGAMASFARTGYDDGAGQVSPHVYWVRDSEWAQLTVQESQGIQVHVPPTLSALVDDSGGGHSSPTDVD